MYKKWNVFLATLTFLLCIFGTFITRSGFVESVHAFARSNIGYYFLGFIGLVLPPRHGRTALAEEPASRG